VKLDDVADCDVWAAAGAGLGSICLFDDSSTSWNNF